MKKIVSIIALITILLFSSIILSGCTLTVETTENSVSASVDGDTTEKVDGIIDWIKARINRVFNTSSEKEKITSGNTEKI